MKRKLKLFLSFASGLITQSVIAQTHLASAVPFYRSPQSQFVSGEENRAILESKILRSEFGVQYEVSYDNSNYVLDAESLLRDLQTSSLAHVKTKLFAYEMPHTRSRVLSTLLADTSVAILNTKPYWAEIFLPKLKRRAYVPLHMLSPVEKDEGVLLPLIDTKLLSSADVNSQSLNRIPKGTRLLGLEYIKGYIRVQFKGQFGFVDSSHVVGRADFAKWAYHKSKGWMLVQYRNNDHLIVSEKSVALPMKDFIAFATNPKLGIVTQILEKGPSIKARVQIAKMRAQSWAVSSLPKHGEVFWRESEQDLIENSTNENTISTDELLKRDVQSVAFVNGTNIKGLVSAKGIYKTLDGMTWTKIPLFTNEDHPVSIHADGTWFVGSYRSRDKGVSFEPYIKWDLLAEKVQEALARPARYLKIQKIEALAQSQILLTLDTGVERLHMKGHWQSNNWHLIKDISTLSLR